MTGRTAQRLPFRPYLAARQSERRTTPNSQAMKTGMSRTKRTAYTAYMQPVYRQ
jgi:hypothetical protein